MKIYRIIFILGSVLMFVVSACGVKDPTHNNDSSDTGDSGDSNNSNLDIIVNPNGGFFSNEIENITMTLSSTGDGDTDSINCDIYYTLDGTNPTTSSNKYETPISIPEIDGGGIITLKVLATYAESTYEKEVKFAFGSYNLDFLLLNWDEELISLNEFKGVHDYLLLNFSSTSCLNCTLEAKLLDEGIQKIKDEGHSFESVTILVVNHSNLDPTLEELSNWAKKYNLVYVTGDSKFRTYNAYHSKYGNSDGSNSSGFPYQVLLKYNSDTDEYDLLESHDGWSYSLENFVNNIISLIEQ